MKKIGKDTVVMITLKQGEKLNKHYDWSTNEIKNLKDSLHNMSLYIKDTVHVYKYEIDSLKVVADNYKSMYEKSADLQIKKEEYHYKEKKLHAWHTFAIGLLLMVLASQ